MATSGQSNLLLTQVPTGFGMSAVGGVSQPAGDPLRQLIAAIVAAKPGHTSGDQSQLTGISSAAQRTALVIDTPHLPVGSKLALNAVDFAAVIGTADVSIKSSGQVVVVMSPIRRLPWRPRTTARSSRWPQ